MKILVLSHGDLAKELCNTLRIFFSEAEAKYIGLKSEGVEFFSCELQKYLEKDSDDVLILCDLQGGTPFNQAVNICTKLNIQHKTEIVSGVNLPMLLELYALKDGLDIKSVKQLAEDSGKSGIGSFNLPENIQDDDF